MALLCASERRLSLVRRRRCRPHSHIPEASRRSSRPHRALRIVAFGAQGGIGFDSFRGLQAWGGLGAEIGGTSRSLPVRCCRVAVGGAGGSNLRLPKRWWRWRRTALWSAPGNVPWSIAAGGRRWLGIRVLAGGVGQIGAAGSNGSGWARVSVGSTARWRPGRRAVGAAGGGGFYTMAVAAVPRARWWVLLVGRPRRRRGTDPGNRCFRRFRRWRTGFGDDFTLNDGSGGGGGGYSGGGGGDALVTEPSPVVAAVVALLTRVPTQSSSPASIAATVRW